MSPQLTMALVSLFAIGVTLLIAQVDYRMASKKPLTGKTESAYSSREDPDEDLAPVATACCAALGS